MREMRAAYRPRWGLAGALSPEVTERPAKMSGKTEDNNTQHTCWDVSLKGDQVHFAE